jgi:hypothetical protein
MNIHCAHAAVVDVTDLRPNPRNPNKHPDEQVALLAKNIRALGWRHPVIVSKRSGLVVAGHARIEAARLLGTVQVPVDYQDFASEAEETAYLIADNRIAELAERDNAAIKDLLQELDTGETDMDLTGYTASAMEELILQEHQGSDVDAEPQVDRADELRVKWGVELGQLWQLGEHRLLCGDSTKPEDVARVMGGEKVDALITDPPYGVDFKGKAEGRGSTPTGYIGGDNNAGPGVVAMLLPMAERGVVFCGNRLLHDYPKPRDIGCVYCPAGAGTGPWGFICFHAILFYGSRQGGPRSPSSFTSNHVSEKNGHPCPKPVEWMTWAIEIGTCERETVLEPFGGSGTTMVAAQNLGRKCYGMEISPSYCAVIIERMATAFPGIVIKQESDHA